MKHFHIIGLLFLISFQSVSQTISVSSLSGGIIYRQLYPDGEYVKKSNLPNFDFRWRIEIFPGKAWRLSVQPGVFSRLYSLHDEMYDNSFTSKRYMCPAISVNVEKHFRCAGSERFFWSLYAGITPANISKEKEWIFNCTYFPRTSLYFQGGGMYHFSQRLSIYAQLNAPLIRNMYGLPINAGLGSGNTPGAYLSTPTLGNERWSITAGVQFGIGRKKE